MAALGGGHRGVVAFARSGGGIEEVAAGNEAEEVAADEDRRFWHVYDLRGWS